MSQCRACHQESDDLTKGYCIPCTDALREMIDELDSRQREIDQMDDAPYWADRDR